MHKVIVLSGVSGSGKSHYVKRMIEETDVVVSADDFFTQDDGSYVFDPGLLSSAHERCFNNFLNFAHYDLRSAHGPDRIFVDNTNTEAWEIAPYMLAASAFGWEAEILTFMLAPNCRALELAAARNKHGVPLHVIANQQRRIYFRDLPRHWKETKRLVEF